LRLASRFHNALDVLYALNFDGFIGRRLVLQATTAGRSEQNKEMALALRAIERLDDLCLHATVSLKLRLID